MKPIRVLCVDDSTDVLAVLSVLLRRAPDLECVGTLSEVDDLASEAEACGADVVVVDLGIPGFDSLEQLHALSESDVPAKIIVFSGDNEERSINLCLEAGADAFVTKATDPRLLLNTIRNVIRNADNTDHPGQVQFLHSRELPQHSHAHHH